MSNIKNNRESFYVGDAVRRSCKYLIEGIVVALAAYYIPKGIRLKYEEVAMIAITAAATFAILDIYTPSIGYVYKNSPIFETNN